MLMKATIPLFCLAILTITLEPAINQLPLSITQTAMHVYIGMCKTFIFGALLEPVFLAYKISISPSRRPPRGLDICDRLSLIYFPILFVGFNIFFFVTYYNVPNNSDL